MKLMTTAKITVAFFDSNETHHCWKDILEIGHVSIVISKETLSLPSLSGHFSNASAQMDDLAEDSLHLCVKIPENQSIVYDFVTNELKNKKFMQSFELEVHRSEIKPEMLYFACIYHRNHTQNNRVTEGEEQILQCCGDNIVTWKQFIKEVQFKLGLIQKYGD